jgi:Mg-chelatase subunit ChlI
VRHPARFVLIGSGNPEEGELRPQLLDRFGMRVMVRTVREPEAAFEGRDAVSLEDVARVVACCRRHRLRKGPLETIDSGDRVVKVFCQVFHRPLPTGEADRRALELELEKVAGLPIRKPMTWALNAAQEQEGI